MSFSGSCGDSPTFPLKWRKCNWLSLEKFHSSISKNKRTIYVSNQRFVFPMYFFWFPTYFYVGSISTDRNRLRVGALSSHRRLQPTIVTFFRTQGLHLQITNTLIMWYHIYSVRRSMFIITEQFLSGIYSFETRLFPFLANRMFLTNWNKLVRFYNISRFEARVFGSLGLRNFFLRCRFCKNYKHQG